MRHWAQKLSRRMWGASIVLVALICGCAADHTAQVPLDESPFMGVADQLGDPSDYENTDEMDRDLGPLSISIDEPVRAAVIDQADVRVSGTVHNLGQGRVLVNGQTVDTDPQGRFSVDVSVTRGHNRLVTEATRGRVTAEDNRGIFVPGTAKPEDKLENALTLHLGDRGLDALGRVVANAVNTIDIAQVIRDSGSEIGGFKVKEVGYNGLVVDLQPRNGFLQVRLVIQDLRIEFRGQFDVLFVPVVVHGDAAANAVTIEANLHINKTSDGSVDFEIRNRNVDLRGFNLEIDNVSDGITNQFESTARNQAERLLSKTLSDFVIPHLFKEAMLEQEVEVMGKKLGIDLDVDRVLIDRDGLTLILGSKITVPQVVREMGMPTIGMQPVRRTENTGVQLAASIDFINSILMATWSSGAPDLEFTSEDDMFRAFGVPVLRVGLGDAAEGLANDDLLTYRIRPLLPPVARMDGESPVTLEMSDVFLDIIGPQGTLVTLALDLSMGIELSAPNGATLSIEHDFVVDASATVVEMPAGTVNVRALEQQVESVIPMVPAEIAAHTFNTGNSVTDMPLQIFEVGFRPSGNLEWLDISAFFDTP